MICHACLQVNKDEPEAECAAREARLHPEHVGSRCSPSLRQTQHTGFRGAWVRHFAIFGGWRLCGGTNRQAVYPAVHNPRHQRAGTCCMLALRTNDGELTTACPALRLPHRQGLRRRRARRSVSLPGIGFPTFPVAGASSGLPWPCTWKQS
jgi:hypothetical protein